MRSFDVQSIELDVPFADAFLYLANPATLPEWTHAFRAADDRQATMVTPLGAVKVGLVTDTSETHGTIDWTITFPDGARTTASSRLVPHGAKTIFIFVLEAPPLPLEELEGALEAQSRILAHELTTLAQRLTSSERLQIT